MIRNFYLLHIAITCFIQVGILQAQEYTVAGDFDYAPYSFIDKNGNAAGLDIDILNAIAAETGLTFKYQLSEWSEALNSIESGKADILASIIFSEEREKVFDFTHPTHAGYYSLYIRKELPFNEISDLQDYKLMVLDKDISIDEFLIPMGLYKDFSVAKSLPDALAGIEWGRADYVVAPYSVGMNEIINNKYENIHIKATTIISSIYCLAVEKGNTNLLGILNKGISELRANGELKKLHTKWMVYDDGFKYESLAKYIGIVFTVVIALLILFFIWVWQLRTQIKKKTQNLNQKNLELQKSEEKFRIITENSSDIIWHLDKDLKLTYISAADERIRGYKKEEVIGEYIWSILKPEGIKLLKGANNKRLVNEVKGVRSIPAIYEVEEICKDGSWIWIEATATPHYDQDGNILGYHGVSRDISERKKTEKLLKEREIQLKELIITKDKMFSIIAHDLRSPFNGILGYSDLLKNNIESYDIEKARKYSEMINSSAKNTLVLLDNLLKWAESQSGKITFDPTILQLKPIVLNIIEVLKPSAEIKNISINCNQSIDLEVFADENMLNTVLRNIISNGIKFTNQNGKIDIYAEKNDTFVIITVSDNGIGIDEKTLNKLFFIDKNVKTKGTANEKGSGLGLILCKDFINKHGGKIWIESEVGKGSNFKFSLPLK